MNFNLNRAVSTQFKFLEYCAGYFIKLFWEKFCLSPE